jgi:hypothetical protein
MTGTRLATSTRTKVHHPGRSHLVIDKLYFGIEYGAAAMTMALFLPSLWFGARRRKEGATT